MKRLILLLCCLLTLSGCSKPQTQEKLNILCPSGAPSLALTSIYDQHNITIVEGTDMLIAELSKPDSSYDIIIAPINLGTKLISTSKTDYRLDSVLTWGNLYLVGTSEDDLKDTGEIALFGAGAVPEKIYTNSNIETTLTPNYYNGGSFVQSQLLLQKAKIGMLPEPLVSATIAKAKQSNLELKIIADLQELYAKNKGLEYGYPQAAIFCKDNKKVTPVLKEIEKYSQNDFEGIKENIDAIGVDTLKLPSTEITVKSLPKQNIKYKKAKDCEKEIETFLKDFNITYDHSMLLND